MNLYINMEGFILDGIAVGGPRNGVRLTASGRWNGIVRKGSALAEMYPGHYEFDPDAGIWVWHPKDQQT
jgi:hypothetical protein